MRCCKTTSIFYISWHRSSWSCLSYIHISSHVLQCLRLPYHLPGAVIICNLSSWNDQWRNGKGSLASVRAPSAVAAAMRTPRLATWQRGNARPNIPTRHTLRLTFTRAPHENGMKITWKSYETEKQPLVALGEGFGPKGLWAWTQTDQTHVDGTWDG